MGRFSVRCFIRLGTKPITGTRGEGGNRTVGRSRKITIKLHVKLKSKITSKITSAVTTRITTKTTAEMTCKFTSM